MEKLNLLEILKNVPKGTKLYSPLIGECKFYIDEINMEMEGDVMFPILIGDEDISLTSEGKFLDDPDAECVLFPSKENRDWSTFKFEYNFKEGDPVWFRDIDDKPWEFGYFAEKIDGLENGYGVIRMPEALAVMYYKQCKPFTGQDPYKE